jgi:acyl-CoA thioester hydrolase
VPFALEVTVQPSDIDNLGHASNIVYLRWVQDVALAHTTSLGLAERDYLALGKGWVVRKHEIEYLRPALSGDRLTLETRVVSMSVASSVRKTRILRGGDELCRATTDWVFVELNRQRPCRIPKEVQDRFPLEP